MKTTYASCFRLKVFIELDIWATNPPQKRDEEKDKEEGEEEETENVWELIGRWDVDNELQLKEGRLKPFQENYFSVEGMLTIKKSLAYLFPNLILCYFFL